MEDSLASISQESELTAEEEAGGGGWGGWAGTASRYRWTHVPLIVSDSLCFVAGAAGRQRRPRRKDGEPFHDASPVLTDCCATKLTQCLVAQAASKSLTTAVAVTSAAAEEARATRPHLITPPI